MLSNDDMVEILDQVEDLPTLPTIYSKLSALLEKPNVAVNEVAALVGTDQAVSSKILKLVNSSFFGFKRTIVSVQQAIVLLGFKSLRNSVLSVSVFEGLKAVSNGSFDLKRFWRHSIACGIISMVLDEELKLGFREEAFVSGILHDLGKVVLNRYFPDEFQKAVDYARENQVTFFEGEKAVIGFSHDEVGEYLADRWQLPFSLVEAVALHHQPNNIRSSPQLVAIVHLADAICHRLPYGFMSDQQKSKVDPFVLKELEINKDSLGPILNDVREQLRANEGLFAALN